MAKIAASKQQWWSSLTDECPITLEPLSSLPYPPFILTVAAGAKGCKNYCFDGLALATYIVSQGAFANPLTREPLNYNDCVRLDRYLNEHIYQKKNDLHLQEHHISVLGLREQKICVKEAWLLRDSIKVNVGGGSSEQSETQRRRAETLRNEAAAALRGLFVYGHHSQNNRGGNSDNGWSSSGQIPNSRSPPSAPPGGFNLHHNPDSNSINFQEGLRIIDDNEAAFEAADVAAWRDLQEAFPTLPYSNEDRNAPQFHNSDIGNNDRRQMSETVRQTAKITLEEEKQETERIARIRQRYFLQALERKRNRIDAQRKAKEEASSALSREKEANDVLQLARCEIDQWRAQQWDEWERSAQFRRSKAKAEGAGSGVKLPPEETENEPKSGSRQSTSQNQEPTIDEKAAKAAAKKKIKRQKAKERAKEKKRLEKLETEKKEQALALKKEKESSAVKCGACGAGILGCGFDKYGVSFCSTKCARNGPSTKN